MSRSKAKGTRAESAVVKAAQAAGLHAERRALKGHADEGDIHLNYGRGVVEVKNHTRTPSPTQVAAWWAETEAEAERVVACDLSVLVVNRPGCGVGSWRAFVRVDDYLHATRTGDVDCPRVVELPLGDLLADLAAAGWAR